ncbi:MAG: LysM domain-containing protein [Planctomycetota bacterium]
MTPAPVAPAPAPRFEPNYNYTPPSYNAPKFTERSEPVPFQEAPKKYTIRPREKDFSPQDVYEDNSDRNRAAKNSLPRGSRSEDCSDDHQRKPSKKPRNSNDFNDDYADQPWNKPVAKGVQPCPTNRASICSHKVEAGETMSAIALQHLGSSSPRAIARMAAANPGVNPDRIYIGQTLYIPCGNSTALPVETEPETAMRRPQPRIIRATGECASCIPISVF